MFRPREAPVQKSLDRFRGECDSARMSVFNFKEEIQKLEQRKWDILLARGQYAAVELWKPIDERLNKLYVWWTNEAYANGNERELPFHLRRRE